jgi:hypothetical protein
LLRNPSKQSAFNLTVEAQAVYRSIMFVTGHTHFVSK